jgi:hypothetical protein
MTRLRLLAAVLVLVAAFALVAVLGRYEVVGVGPPLVVARLIGGGADPALHAPPVLWHDDAPTEYEITTPTGLIHHLVFDHTPDAVEFNSAVARITGPDLRKLSDEDLLKLVPDVSRDTDLEALSDEELLKRFLPLQPGQP